MTEMTQSEIKASLMEKASRRSIYPSVEAKLLQIEVRCVKNAIQSLRRAGLIFQSDRPLRSYWGTVEAGYRAVKQ